MKLKKIPSNKTTNDHNTSYNTESEPFHFECNNFNNNIAEMHD